VEEWMRIETNETGMILKEECMRFEEKMDEN
jgi:hypothetical protein